MEIEAGNIRGHRLRAHHLNQKMPMEGLAAAAGACGLQNTPPGAWETALHARLDGCTQPALEDALYGTKELLQAWSFRGAPVVFPTGQSDVFLTPLIAREDEQPWVYTRGITGALDYLQMPFDDLLRRVKKAAQYLGSHTVKSKETLDQTLADLVLNDLPKEKQGLWQAPSMYGRPDRQTVGGAAVSFLLRPCSFYSLVVFGRRQGTSPTFTSFQNWVGRAPAGVPGAEKELVRKFLHCYGPATVEYFMNWLGCSPRQAKRLWNGIAEEMAPVRVAGKAHYMLAADMKSLLATETGGEKLLLLGPHDPYLDMRDRTVILENKALHKTVWQFVSNPGAILKGGRVIGIWKAKTLKGGLEVSMRVWEDMAPAQRKELERLAGEYAAFRLLPLKSCVIESM